MRILIFLSHPAQFLFYKHPVIRLRAYGHEVHILIKSKDILQKLVEEQGWIYHNILPKERGRSRVAILMSLITRTKRLLRYARKHRIELLAGSDASLAITGKLLHIPCVTTVEDDFNVIKYLAYFTYPITTHILVPENCNIGKWESKKIGYPGYMKLAYLHPAIFVPDWEKTVAIKDKSYFLIRLSGLKAHHDFKANGININTLRIIIEKLEKSGRVFVNSENELPTEFQPYRLTIPASDMHHYLYYAKMLISDSQSMTVEAAMLGTPSIRVSSFTGRISVLEELEHKYHLTFGIKPGDDPSLMAKIDELLSMPDAGETFQFRRKQMLDEKINVTEFVTWFFHTYPDCIKILKDNPDHWQTFFSKEKFQLPI